MGPMAKDILIYCISWSMEKRNRSGPIGPWLRTSCDVLAFTNRGTAGKDYDALCEALDRTTVKTNIPAGDEEKGTLRIAASVAHLYACQLSPILIYSHILGRALSIELRTEF